MTAYLNPSPQVTALVSRLSALLAAPAAKRAVPGPDEAVTSVNGSEPTDSRVSGPSRPWKLYDRLTADDVRAIVEGRRRGALQQELAVRFGISVSSVQRVLRDHG